VTDADGTRRDFFLLQSTVPPSQKTRKKENLCWVKKSPESLRSPHWPEKKRQYNYDQDECFLHTKINKQQSPRKNTGTESQCNQQQ
jgi:hypothetical protein